MHTAEHIYAAYAHCQDIANQHYENFPTASLLLRKDIRGAIAVIYAFAREADDFADEGERTKAERLALLDDWEQQLDLCLVDKSDNLIFVALSDVMGKHHLPVQLFKDLLEAFRMDVHFQGFDSLEDLKFYCKHSANPVGRLMLALHDIQDEQALLASDAICSALQLTNFWQDFKIDVPKGRCYLAQDWLGKTNIKREDLLAGKLSSTQLKPAIDVAIAETFALFELGYQILPLLPLRLRAQIAATLVGGLSILNATSNLADPLHQRPTLTKLDWLGAALKVGVMTLFSKHFIRRGQREDRHEP